MISYSKYKLLKEADAPVPAAAPGGTTPAGGAESTPGGPPTGDIGSPPPGFSGGPPMGGLGGLGGGGGPSTDMGMGGPPTSGSPQTDLKPSSLKSSNVWDVLEDILSNSSEK